MASSKYYAYYVRGSKIAIIQHDYTLGTGQTLSQPGLNSVGARGDVLWKSPTEDVTDGLEIEYAYSPRYRINNTATTVACDSYTSASGLLKIVDTGNGLPTSGVTHIVISGSEKWNGLHKVNTLTAGHTILETKYNSGSVTEAFTTYTDIDALTDESDEIDLPEYMAKALVYYVKAKVAEDRMELEQKEYNMREFKRLLEINESSKVWGARRIGTDDTAIK